MNEAVSTVQARLEQKMRDILQARLANRKRDLCFEMGARLDDQIKGL